MLPCVKRQGDTEEEMDEAFRVFDKEGNGQINAVELRCYVLCCAQQIELYILSFVHVRVSATLMTYYVLIPKHVLSTMCRSSETHVGTNV